MLTGGVVAIVLASATVWNGGRDPNALLVHHTLLVAAALFLVVTSRPSQEGGGRGAFALAAFALYALALSPYRYSTLLVLADITAAALIYWLTTVASRGSMAGTGMVVGGLLTGAGASAAWVAADLCRGGPAQGPFANPNHTAALLAAAASLLLARAVAPNARLRTRALASIGALLGAAGVALVGSRGGLLALLAGGATALLLGGRRRFLAGLALTLGFLALGPTPLGRKVRGGNAADFYAYERSAIWKASARMALDALPRGGVGLGGFSKAAHAWNFPVEGAVARYGKLPNNAHNQPLHLLAEAGVPGLLVLVLPFLGALRGGWRKLAGPARTATASLLAATLALAAHMAVETVLEAPANLYVFAALLGLLAEEPPARPVGDAPRTWPRPLAVLAVVSLWAFAVALPWAGDRAFRRYLGSGSPEDLDQALRLVPGHAGYREAAGARAARVFAASGKLEDLDSARHWLVRAIDLDPGDADHPAHLAALEASAFLGPLPALELALAAIDHVSAAIALAPFNPFLRYQRASLLEGLGRRDEAQAEAKRAVALEPNFRSGHELLWRAARTHGDRIALAREESVMAAIDQLRRQIPLGSVYETRMLAVVDRSAGVARVAAPQ